MYLSRTNLYTIVIGIVVVAIVAGLIIYAVSNKALPFQGGGPLTTIQYPAGQSYNEPILLTALPVTSVTANSTVIGYSAVSLHMGSNSTYANGGGTSNLQILVNKGMVIGGVSSSKNISAITMGIVSATLSRGGLGLSGNVSNGGINIPLSGSGNAILIGIATLLAGVYTSNATSYFVMPVVRASFISGSSSSSLGSTVSLDSSQISKISPQGLAILYTSINPSSNNTISITITNKGLQPVDIKDIFLYGNFSVNVHLLNGTVVNVSRGFNVPSPANLNTSSTSRQDYMMLVDSSGIADYGMLNFVPAYNGTLVVPSQRSQLGTGYSVAPNSKVVLTLSNNVSISNMLYPKLASASEYSVVVLGSDNQVAYVSTQSAQ